MMDNNKPNIDEINSKIKVGVLGATNMVDQRFLSLLAEHPWYEVAVVAASARSEGKTYEAAVGDRWKMPAPMPEYKKAYCNEYK